MSEVKITPISSDRRLLGESPHWMEKEQCLVYVDLLRGMLHRYFIETQRHQSLHIEEAGSGSDVGFVIPIKDCKNEFVIGVGRTISSVIWPSEDPDVGTKKPNPLLSLEKHETITRINDAKCDPSGRLWTGTMSCEAYSPDIVPHKGTLYRIDQSLKATVQARWITVSNGLCWSNDKTTMYYVDSMEYRVDAFDYNDASGQICNRRPVIDFKANGIEGIPDGMAIDVEGNLWVACFNGSQVICVNPSTRKMINKIEFPSKGITSCCWGGLDYTTLFVTSGTYNLSEKELQTMPHAGKTFAVTGLGVRGLPPVEFKFNQIDCLK